MPKLATFPMHETEKEDLKRIHGCIIQPEGKTHKTYRSDNDPAVEPLVEIYQGDRVSAEYEGAPKAANRADVASAPGGFRPAGYVWNAWAKGYKLGHPGRLRSPLDAHLLRLHPGHRF